MLLSYITLPPVSSVSTDQPMGEGEAGDQHTSKTLPQEEVEKSTDL